MSRAPVPVLCNARAGTVATDAASLLRGLGGPEAVEVRVVEPGALGAAVEAAAHGGAAVVGVAGGDGSLRTAAAALAGTDTALLPIPTGTLNHFARRCGIASVRDARAALAANRRRTLPVGVAGEHVFLNTLTLGEYARTVRMRERLRPRIGKWPAALVAFVRTVLSARRFTISLELDGRRLSRHTPFLWIGLGWGSFPRVHQALERRNAPDLEVAVLRAGSALDGFGFLLRLAWGMLRGRQPVRDRALEVVHTRRLMLDAASAIDATADGEVLKMDPPVHVTVRDGALHVVTGPDR